MQQVMTRGVISSDITEGMIESDSIIDSARVESLFFMVVFPLRSV